MSPKQHYGQSRSDGLTNALQASRDPGELMMPPRELVHTNATSGAQSTAIGHEGTFWDVARY